MRAHRQGSNLRSSAGGVRTEGGRKRRRRGRSHATTNQQQVVRVGLGRTNNNRKEKRVESRRVHTKNALCSHNDGEIAEHRPVWGGHDQQATRTHEPANASMVYVCLCVCVCVSVCLCLCLCVSVCL